MVIELVIVFVIIGIILIFLIPILKMRFATTAVLKEFCTQNALSPETAKTAEELGIAGQSIFDRLIKSQDYKPHALLILKNAKIIQEIGENRLYLDEENLANSAYSRHLCEKR